MVEEGGGGDLVEVVVEGVKVGLDEWGAFNK